ncbi:MAG: ROK family transcriptional regulator [Erysipelotrichaceae bacterium]|nr:ROK family transcriptional regulator [Erysipelotrichaceae bacterium]
MENLGRNQSFARKVNSGLVLSRLRKSDCSATILAEELNLSNAAMSSILKELENQNMIVHSHALSTVGKGRKQIYYTLNKDYGLFIVVCLSNNRCKIIVSNLKEEILIKEEKEIDRYDVSVIYEIILRIKSILALPEYRDLPLVNIYIAVPGKVNSLTNEVQVQSSKHFDKSLFEEKDKISQLFETHFSAPVFIENDINLAIIGERKCGALDSSNDSLLVYVDNGIGAAMIFDGNFYKGSSGYAGELGLTRVTVNGEENYLDEFVSLRSIKNYFKEKYHREFKHKDLVELFYQDDEAKDYILKTSKILGKKLKDIVELLNISKIVLQGRISYFQDQYLQVIKDEVNQSSNQCEVEFSKLNGDSIFIGAMAKAVDYLVDKITTREN